MTPTKMPPPMPGLSGVTTVIDQPYNNSLNDPVVLPGEGEISEGLSYLQQEYEYHLYDSGSITPRTQGEAQFDSEKLSLNDVDGRAVTYRILLEETIDITQRIQAAKPGDFTSEEMRVKKEFLADYAIGIQEFDHIEGKKVVFISEYQYTESLEEVSSPQVSSSSSATAIPLEQKNLFPTVNRFGINPLAVKAAAGYGIAGDRLHYVEQEVFADAFRQLDEVISTEAFSESDNKTNIPPNNVVLVDIFAREGGRIKLVTKDELTYPEMHTVVLWKKKDNEIILIDPSKKAFSEHIPGALKRAGFKIFLPEEGKGLKLSFARVSGDVVYASGGVDTGYSTYQDDKPKPRDCIDIGVKIAFELNDQQVKGTSPADIEKNMLAQISNLKKLNPLFVLMDRAYLREMQSSSAVVRADAARTLGKTEIAKVIPKLKGHLPALSLQAIVAIAEQAPQKKVGLPAELEKKKGGK